MMLFDVGGISLVFPILLLVALVAAVIWLRGTSFLHFPWWGPKK